MNMTFNDRWSSRASSCLLIFYCFTKIAASELYTCPAITPANLSPKDPIFQSRPFIDGAKTFVGGKITDFEGQTANATTPIVDSSTGERIVIGRLAQMEEVDALAALDAAKKAWDKGQGLWPQMSAENRIKAMETFVELLILKRAEIIEVLTWEICK
jgi:glyceraldehyde-3-phosphate dehydrogenase (NADP+)